MQLDKDFLNTGKNFGIPKQKLAKPLIPHHTHRRLDEVVAQPHLPPVSKAQDCMGKDSVGKGLAEVAGAQGPVSVPGQVKLPVVLPCAVSPAGSLVTVAGRPLDTGCGQHPWPASLKSWEGMAYRAGVNSYAFFSAGKRVLPGEQDALPSTPLRPHIAAGAGSGAKGPEGL